jgi:transcription elongation factor GreA
MPTKEVLMTYEGLKKIESELDYLKGTKRREIAERIKQAIEFGDISENSEYDDAKNDQAKVETRIVSLEKMLKNAKIIDEDEVDTAKVSIGATVKIHMIEMDEEAEYKIVGSTEANPEEHRISNESPVGSSLINKKVGDIVEVTVPDGLISFKVLDIHK